MQALAINGGPPAVPKGTLQPTPPITALDEKMVLASLRSWNHTWGENCESLQREFAEWNGNKYCLAMTSGTAALHACMLACGVAAGDEVITPAYSWTSSVSCILHANCIPVFVDVEPVSYNIDPALIEDAITPRTKAIIAVHLHGVPAAMDAIMEIALRRNLCVVEDACQAHGALYKGRKVGTIGKCAAFSLNQNKMLSAGEGGLFVTDDADALERARSLMLFGDFRAPSEDPNYHFYGLGYMYRYNELCAAWARAQLTRLDEGIAHARSLFAVLRDRLDGLAGLILPTEPKDVTGNAYNFVCHVDPAAVGYDGETARFREAIITALAAEGVPASVWQRRILPEMAAVAAKNAFGNGSPWREHNSQVDYDPRRFPVALAHSDSYFIIGGLRQPNTIEAAKMIGDGVRKVFEHINALDIDGLADRAEVTLYERGWKGRRLT